MRKRLPQHVCSVLFTYVFRCFTVIKCISSKTCFVKGNIADRRSVNSFVLVF